MRFSISERPRTSAGVIAVLLAVLLCAHAQVGVIGRSIGQAAGGTAYYFAATGRDKNPCTSSSPCQTIAHANTLTLYPGDRVLFNGGDTFNDATLAIRTSGASDNPILFGSYGRGHAKFGCNDGQCVTITDASYVTVERITMIGPGVVPGTGMMADNSTRHKCAVDASSSQTNRYLNSLTLTSLNISGVWCGIYVHGAAASTPKGWDGLDVGGTNSDPLIIHDAIWMGIWINGSPNATQSGFPHYLAADRIHKHVHVHHWEVYNIYGRFTSQYTAPTIGQPNPPAGFDYNFTGSGLVVSNVTGAADGDNLVELGLAHDNGQNNNDSRGGPCNVWTFESDYVTFQTTESHHAKTGAQDGCAFDADGGATHTIFQSTYAHDNRGAGFQTGSFTGETIAPHDITFRFNISEKDSQAFRTFNNFATNVTFERNTIYASGLPSCTVNASYGAITGPNVTSLNWTLRNNIIVTDNDACFLLLWSNTATIIGNEYWSTAGTPRWRNVDGGGVVASLSGFRAMTGTPEVYMSANVGTSIDPHLARLGRAGSINNIVSMNRTLTAYDPTMTSPVPRGGVSGGTTAKDFHGNASMVAGQGAVQ